MVRARVLFLALLLSALLNALAAPARAGSFSLVKDRLKMPDGVEQAVTYFMPSSASSSSRCPVLLRMNPYQSPRREGSFLQIGRERRV